MPRERNHQAFPEKPASSHHGTPDYFSIVARGADPNNSRDPVGGVLTVLNFWL